MAWPGSCRRVTLTRATGEEQVASNSPGEPNDGWSRRRVALAGTTDRWQPATSNSPGEPNDGLSRRWVTLASTTNERQVASNSPGEPDHGWSHRRVTLASTTDRWRLTSNSPGEHDQGWAGWNLAGRSPWRARAASGRRRATRLASPTVGEVADGSPGEGDP